MNNASLTGGVLIQTVSEFLDGFLKLKRKKGIREKSDSDGPHKAHQLETGCSGMRRKKWIFSKNLKKAD